MDLLPIPPLSKQALKNQSVPPAVQLVIELIVTCLNEVCRGVVDDCDKDERHDDSTSEGGLRWRRCRNYVKKLLDAKAVPGLEEAVADVSDNALKVRMGDTAVSFYSARNGIDRPDLSGGRKTKKAIVTEMQQQIVGLESTEQPRQLIVVYEADADGLAASVVGMLRSAKVWEWRYSVYERVGLGIADTEIPANPDVPAYDTEPEPELGEFEMLDETSEEENRGSGDDG
jgi:hypothetical protein